MRLSDVGAILKAEIARAENTVVIGAQQMQVLAGSTQAKLKDTVAQAEDAISDASAISLNARQHVQFSIDRVTQQIAPETVTLEQSDGTFDQAVRVQQHILPRSGKSGSTVVDVAWDNALRSDSV